MESNWLVRILAWLAAILFLIYGLASPSFRDSEGYLVGAACLPISLGIALFVFGWVERYRRFAFWLGLAMAGQAATLQLIEAGKEMGYQHYKPVERLWSETNPLLLLFLAAQACLVGYAYLKKWPVIRRWLAQNFKWWQVAGVLLLSSLFSATVSQAVIDYAVELAFAALFQTIFLLNLLLAVLAIPEEVLANWKQRLERVFGPAGEEGPGEKLRIDWYVALAAVWVVILSALLNIFSYQRHPHIPDEVVYLYQARFLAHGALALPAPPVPQAFDVYLMQFDGARWYPSPPPGWPAVLAVGELLGVPWLVNPILGGINILLIYRLLGWLYSRRIAHISVFLLCLSPWYIFMAMNFMTHTFTLTCALVATLGVIEARETGQTRWAWLAGGALGMMSLIRPLEGMVQAGLLGLWAIGIGGRRLKFASLFALVAGAVLVGALVIPYNQALTGHPAVFPINRYTDERFGPNANAYGFGPDRGMGWPIDPNRGHGPVDALINANLNTFSINIELFGWSIGSLLLIGLWAFSGSYHKSDGLMLAVIIANFVFYFFYYFSGGPDFGARYWFLMIVPLVAFTARGIQTLEIIIRQQNPGFSTESTRVLVGVLLLSGMALFNIFPWRAVDKYLHYLDMRPDVRQLAAKNQFGRSLVLIKGDEQPDYASAFVYNPLDFYADATIFAWDRNPEIRARLLAAYPDRPVWILSGPSLTQGGYEVITGPLPPSEINH